MTKYPPDLPTSATSGIPIASISLMSLIAVDRDILNSRMISEIVKVGAVVDIPHNCINPFNFFHFGLLNSIIF